METFTRYAISNTSSATASAVLKLGAGVWEILGLSCQIGGSVVILTVTNIHGEGYVSYESEQQFPGAEIDTKASERLASGRCTLLHPLIMDGRKVVIGPGRIKSYLQHSDSMEHTMVVTYRRLLM